MTTQLTFNGVLFQGILTNGSEGTWASESDRTGLAGAHGEDEIRMGRRGWPIEATVWLHGFADDAALSTYIFSVLKPLINTNGLLSFTGGLSRNFIFTTFDSMEPIDKATTQVHDPVIIGRCQTWRFRFHCLTPT